MCEDMLGMCFQMNLFQVGACLNYILHLRHSFEAWDHQYISIPDRSKFPHTSSFLYVILHSFLPNDDNPENSNFSIYLPKRKYVSQFNCRFISFQTYVQMFLWMISPHLKPAIWSNFLNSVSSYSFNVIIMMMVMIFLTTRDQTLSFTC